MYSQNNEEEFILNHFGDRTGKFLDIGAYNPFSFSNTRKLYEKGWKGIYVEPSPICFSAFVKEYENDSNIVLCNFALGTFDGKATFYDSKGDAIGTLNEGHKDKWEKGSAMKYEPIEVTVVETGKFFNQYGNDIDFLSLDTESTNIEIFDAIPDFFWNRLSLLCIEHDNQIDHICSRLPQFRVLLQNPENLILGR